jgi:cell wall-associated NlpC family hydrolase
MAADRPAAQALRDPLTVSPHSKKVSGPAGAGVVEAARTALDKERSSLTEEFGLALLSVDAVADPARHLVRLEGQVASAHAAARVVEATSAAAPGWRVDGRELATIRTGRWRKLPPGVTALWKSPGGPGCRRRLTSQLVPDDGPVEVLVQARGGTLVRTPRGTLGWIDRSPGSTAPAPSGSRPRRRTSLSTVAATWLGAPYRLGGTLPSGIDCSGLLMRCFAATWEVRLPRHSTDQVPSDLLTDGGASVDDVVLVRDHGGRAHVGLVAARTGEGPLVVHASASRGRVVAEPLARLAAAGYEIGIVSASVLVDVHG